MMHRDKDAIFWNTRRNLMHDLPLETLDSGEEEEEVPFFFFFFFPISNFKNLVSIQILASVVI